METTGVNARPVSLDEGPAFEERFRFIIRDLTAAAHRPIAAFDLDNTLLSGDVGDALFAMLVRNGRSPGFGWSEYAALLRSKKTAAYRRVVTALEGLPISEVELLVAELLQSRLPHIVCAGERVRVPRARRFMKGLVRELQNSGWKVYVLSSSAQIAAESAATRLFEIPREQVFGVRLEVEQERFTRDLVEPAPISTGKVDVYTRFISAERPLLTAGDSILDLPLMDLTSPGGCCLWCGGGDGKIVRRTLARRNVQLLPESLASDLQ